MTLVELTAWARAASLAYATLAEPRNPSPHAAPSVLIDVMVAETADKEELARLIVYAFRESGFSVDPHLAGDCPGLRAGSRECSAAKGALHFGPWQGADASSLAASCHAALRAMRDAIARCAAWPMALYTSGRCAESFIAARRESDVARLASEGP